MSEVYTDVINANLERIETSSSKQAEIPDNVAVSEKALKDADFSLDEDKGILAIIKKLKSHTWPTQNSAISQLEDDLKGLNFSNLSEIQLDALFVLGRNIYQAACGNSYSAIYYLQKIDDNLSKYSEIIRDYVVSGALFEIFLIPKARSVTDTNTDTPHLYSN